MEDKNKIQKAIQDAYDVAINENLNTEPGKRQFKFKKLNLN